MFSYDAKKDSVCVCVVARGARASLRRGRSPHLPGPKARQGDALATRPHGVELAACRPRRDQGTGAIDTPTPEPGMGPARSMTRRRHHGPHPPLSAVSHIDRDSAPRVLSAQRQGYLGKTATEWSKAVCHC